MYCTSCGRQVAPGNQFCPACGTPVNSGTQTSTRAPITVPGDVRIMRPTGLSVIAVLDFIGAGGTLIAVLVAAASQTAFAGDSTGAIVTIVTCVVLAAFGALYLVAGIGLWKLRSYGRTTQIGLSIVGLLGFPIGTIISIAILVYLFKPGIKILFSGRPVENLTAEEALAVKAVTSGGSSTAVVIVVIVAVVVLGVMVIGIIAAIAVPGLLRARMTGNEAAAIGRIRALNSGEAAYSATNPGGAFGTLDCLAAPSKCISGYSGGPMIDPAEMEQAVRAGYRFTFYTTRLSGAGAKPSDLAGYAIVAVPVTPGSTGQRAFCGDASGTICFTPDGSAPTSDGGKCGACQPLQ